MTSELPRRASAAPVVVRAEAPADEAAVHDVVASAFGTEPVSRLLGAMRRSPAWLDLSYVAVMADEVVGHVSFTRGWVDAEQQLVEVLVLSPLSVRPDMQRKGVGGRLVTDALRCTERRDEPLVFLEGAPGYYGRFGFLAGGDLGFTAPSVRVPPLAFQAIRLPAYQTWMSGALVYPDVFWEHDAVGLRQSEH